MSEPLEIPEDLREVYTRMQVGAAVTTRFMVMELIERIAELEAQVAALSKPVTDEEIVQQLVRAWASYKSLFGEPPHGTAPQLAALLEFAHGPFDALIASRQGGNK